MDDSEWVVAGVDDESHGLSFATAKDAAAFRSVVDTAVQELQAEQEAYMAAQAARVAGCLLV